MDVRGAGGTGIKGIEREVRGTEGERNKNISNLLQIRTYIYIYIYDIRQTE